MSTFLPPHSTKQSSSFKQLLSPHSVFYKQAYNSKETPLLAHAHTKHDTKVKDISHVITIAKACNIFLYF